jgi:hypothetical protein
MSEPTKPGLPKLPTGVTDWESVFEDPEKGLLTRLAKITTVSALRHSVTMVINRLHTRKDDAVLRKQHLNTLTDLIPDGTTDDALTDIKASVNAFLLDIESERILRAEAFVQSKTADKSFDHQAAPEIEEPIKPERRQPIRKQPKPVKKPKKPGKKYMVWAGTFTIAASLIFGVYKLLDTSGEEQLPVKQFVEQMANAAAGNDVEQHIYGGIIKTGKSGGRVYVSANKIPSAACASAAWVLVNRGTAIINQVTPSHVTPSVLKKLCTMKGRFAVIYWYPRKVPEK